MFQRILLKRGAKRPKQQNEFNKFKKENQRSKKNVSNKYFAHTFWIVMYVKNKRKILH